MSTGEPRSTRPAWDNPDAMLGVDEARSRILSSFSPLAPISVPILDALGLVLAEDVVSAENIPPFRNSAMDGYAVRSADTLDARSDQPLQLSVCGEIAAGQAGSGQLTPGTAMRIMTGAVVPDGADAVIRFEEVEARSAGQAGAHIALAPAVISVSRPARHWENVRQAGEDVAAGTVVLRSGMVLRPPHIGLLAAMNRATVAVIRRPLVAILSTGDEVVDIGPHLKPGQIRNSNSYTLAAMTRQFGGEPRVIGIAADRASEIKARLNACKDADLLVTSGGVSVGDFDVVKQVLQAEGRIELWQVRIKPGKPMAFGQLGGTSLLGLPGNPAAAAVAFAQFGRPCIRRMLGLPDQAALVIKARLLEAQENRGRRRHFVRGIVERRDGEYVARPLSSQGSGQLSGLGMANCFIVIPEERDHAPVGALVDVELFDDVELR